MTTLVHVRPSALLRGLSLRRSPGGRRTMNTLPGDVLLDVAEYLSESTADLLHFAGSSSYIFCNVIGRLYKQVTLNSAEECVNTLTMLARCPSIASHIQELTLRPENGEIGLGGTMFTVADMISRTAKSFSALHTFIWDASEMPPYDMMWYSLRVLCPRLRSVGTTIGSDIPKRNSHLFAFSDLLGFSVTFKPGFLEDPTQSFDDPAVRFSRLWDMLLDRCPSLESLCVDGTAPESIGGQRIFSGRWPLLKSLTIGDLALEWPSDYTQHPVVSFLCDHPSIQSLNISQHVLPSVQLGSIPNETLPELTEFQGTLTQLQAFVGFGKIEVVDFREAMLVREVTPFALSSALQRLENLTTLRLAFVLQSPYESGTLLRYLIASCPRLTSFDLTCGNKPSFGLESFSRSIHQLPKLRSFTLNVVKYPGDPSLAKCGAQIARANPRLHHFELTLIPSHSELPLPIPLTAYPDAYIERAKFALTADEHGLPLQLIASHRYSESNFPHIRAIVGLRSLTNKRLSYRLDLRPGHQVYNSWRSWIGILLENSVAGEEMRMLLSLIVLLILALWGFLAGAIAPFDDL